MKNKLNIPALTALVMICSGSVQAEGNSVTLNTTLNVEAADNCVINVNAEGKTTWSPKWTLSKNSQSGELTKGIADSTDPLLVRVKFSDDSSANCSLANLKFGADVPQGRHVDDGAKGAYLVGTEHEGFWRFMPVVTKLALFTDADGTSSGTVPLNKVTVKDAAGNNHHQSESVLRTAMTEITGVADFGNQTAIPLTNSYLATDGVAPLSTGNGSTDLSYEATLEAGKSVKNALIGVGTLLAKNPENDNGAVNLKAVENGETIQLPFTLNVSLP